MSTANVRASIFLAVNLVTTTLSGFREFLMKSCWNVDFKKRPQASEIVEFLANNPRLISPSLDVPLSSVVMEDTGQLELNLPNNVRKLSFSSKCKADEIDTGIRFKSTPRDSELFSQQPVPRYGEEPAFYPNGYSGMNDNCPWIPLLENGKNDDGSSRSSSVAENVVTIHRSESCEDLGDEENQTHQTSL